MLNKNFLKLFKNLIFVFLACIDTTLTKICEPNPKLKSLITPWSIMRLKKVNKSHDSDILQVHCIHYYFLCYSRTFFPQSKILHLHFQILVYASNKLLLILKASPSTVTVLLFYYRLSQSHFPSRYSFICIHCTRYVHYFWLQNFLIAY